MLCSADGEKVGEARDLAVEATVELAGERVAAARGRGKPVSGRASAGSSSHPTFSKKNGST
jgi:hypothetical protein